MDGRRVVVFKRRPGADRKLGTTESELRRPNGEVASWGLNGPRGHVYAKVRRKAGDGYVCRADRSPTFVREHGTVNGTAGT